VILVYCTLVISVSAPAWAAPEAPTVAGTTPASPANDNAPRVTGTATAGSTVNLYTDSACTSGPVASGTAEEFASPGITVTVADDSTTSFYAMADDGTGASACSISSATYVEDSTAPSAPTLTVTPPASGNDTTPTWEFTGDTGVSFTCELRRDNGTIVFAAAACTSPHTYDLAAQGEDTYDFFVRAVDAAGNASAATTSTYTLDTGPAAPTFTEQPPAVGNDPTPTWAFTGEAGTTFQCEFIGPGTSNNNSSCPSPYTVDLSGKSDGRYTFRVRSVDAAGNVGPWAESTYTLDRVVAEPTFTVQPLPGPDPMPTWEFTGEPGASFSCELTRDGTVVSPFAACVSPTFYDLSGQPLGTYTLSVRQTDEATNTSSAATSPYTYDTTPQASQDKIAFASDRTGDDEIYVMNNDGSALRRLTTVAGFDWRPSWSPDASKIAFESRRDGNTEIYVMNADGSGQTRLTNNSAADQAATWSPDGTKLLFSSTRNGNYDVYVMNADGSGQTQLTTSTGDDRWPMFSPEGDQIAFASTRAGSWDIWVMNPDGTGQAQLTTLSGNEHYPDYSPDGTKIAISREGTNTSGYYQVATMNRDGSGLVQLTSGSAHNLYPRYSRTGTQLTFYSFRDGNREIYTMSADGSGQTRRTNDSAIDDAPDFQPLVRVPSARRPAT